MKFLKLFIVPSLSFVCALAFVLPLYAETPNFNNLSQSDFDNITREFSENASLHDVMPASSLGIFGFEVGLAGGITQTPNTNSIVQQSSPGISVSLLPHADLVAAVSVPYGFTGELSFVPPLTISGVRYSQYAGAIKWTGTDVYLQELPVNFAVRGFISGTTLSFGQTLNNSSTGFQPVDATITYKGTVTGLHIMVSPKLPFIEPYAGFGFLSGKGTLNVSGTASGTVFSFPSQSADSSSTSTHGFVGINGRLGLLVLGAEYSRAFGTYSVTGKLSARF